MHIVRKRRSLLVTAVGLVLHGGTAAGGPTVIRDEMVADTAITPALGRGYSIATSTYQSLCLTDAVSTSPSFDFDYTFEENPAAAGKPSSRKADPADAVPEAEAKPVIPPPVGKGEYTTMLATVRMNVYYASVDETKSKLSASAMRLIDTKDVASFFDSCGMYYVRSISRQSRIYAVFTMAMDRPLDPGFKTQLEAALEGNLAKEETRAVMKEAKRRRLTVALRDDRNPDGATPRGVDLETFQKQLKARPPAAAQPPAIEVVPWIENPAFQTRLKLAPVTIDDPSCAAGADCTQVVRTVADQKRYLVVNSEFVTELHRSLRDNGLDDRHEAHLYGGADAPAAGVDSEARAALTCLDELFADHRVSTTSYRTLESCRRAERNLDPPAPAAPEQPRKKTMPDGPQPAKREAPEPPR